MDNPSTERENRDPLWTGSYGCVSSDEDRIFEPDGGYDNKQKTK